MLRFISVILFISCYYLVVNLVEPAARNVSMVFENYALYPHMSVFDNIASHEVDFFFGILLKFFLYEKPKVYHEQVELVRAKDFPYDSVPGGKKYPFWRGDYDTYFYYYEDKVVWGMTAAIVRQFIKQIKEKSEDSKPI